MYEDASDDGMGVNVAVLLPPLDPLLVHVLVLLEETLAVDDLEDLLAHAGLAVAHAVEHGEELIESDGGGAAAAVAAVDHRTNLRLRRKRELHGVSKISHIGQIGRRDDCGRGAVLGRVFREELFRNILVLDVLNFGRGPLRPDFDLIQ